MNTSFKFTLLWIETHSLNVYYGIFYSRKGECRGQCFNTLKDNGLVWNAIGWSDKRSISWLRKHAKLRKTGKHHQWRSGWRTEKTLCDFSIYNKYISGCFDTRICKLIILYPYDIVVQLIKFSRFLFQETVSSQERKIILS